MKRFSIILVAFLFCLCGCELERIDESVELDKDRVKNGQEYKSGKKREWTLMMYMSADNNLENAALEDICEMECSSLNTGSVNVLVLLDRSPSYDTSNGNWSGTRLYKLKTGRKPNTVNIISEQLECVELGLRIGEDVEIDMSSDYVLSRFLNYSMEQFPAEHYGLIIWGHGTGWRNQNCEPYKGFSYDETSKTYMSLSQLGKGIENGRGERKLDIVGFDTCFGGEFEVAYEIKDSTRYMVGSEGLIMSSGWDYNALFSKFCKNEVLSAENLIDSIIYQFKNQYAHSNRASITAIATPHIPNLFENFNAFLLEYSTKLTTSLQRDQVMSALYGPNAKTEKYTYGTAGNDIYLDVYSMIKELAELEPEVSAEKFFDAEKKAVINSWASDRDRGGLGVYFSTLTEGNYLSVTFPSSYIKGKTANQIKFVKDSIGYVPCLKAEKGLLDKLFFTAF